ncbi:head-tail connector protein [Methylobacterium oxalidis]|uniref:head-tail connector protein n=1 Tax=Methylobacterium oxalidis TaxID=944322 RepID=UPI003315A0EF
MSLALPAFPIRLDGAAVEPVSLAEMRLDLRLDPDDAAEDGLVSALVAAARARIEAETRRILVPGRFRLALDAWPPDGWLPLPLGPVVALEAASLVARDGTVTALAAGLLRLGPDLAEAPGLHVDGAVPDLAGRRALIEVAAGHGGAGPPVPPPLLLAIRRLAALWFEHRGDEPAAGLPPDIAALAAPYRRLRL